LERPQSSLTHVECRGKRSAARKEGEPVLAGSPCLRYETGWSLVVQARTLYWRAMEKPRAIEKVQEVCQLEMRKPGEKSDIKL
jgi:hypothetical protein